MPTTIDNLLSRMTLEEKIGQMILASIEVSRMDAGTREFLRKNHIGNVILFGKNCAGRAALAQLNAEIQHTVMAENGLPALIAIDQEGGCVTRLRSEATVFPSAMVIARTGDPANAYKVGRMMGGELRALGINLDCAPVLDTLSGPAERRYYGQTVQSIADYGCAMARGLRDAGVLACGKHFPGHEQTGADTHFGFVVDNTPRDTLMNSCLTPFCRAMSEDLASVMVSHVCFPALDDTDTPCSMSAPVIQGVLRGQLGYQGLVISDGLQMHAILDQYGAPQGCVQAALAGCDLLIIGNGGDNADPTGKDVQTPCIRALCDAVADGTLPMARVDESVRRILACKLALGWTMPARDAASQQFADFISLNRYYGWYVMGGMCIVDAETAFRKEMDGWAQVLNGRPMIFTEYGADTMPSEHKLPSVMWSQEYQNEYLDMNHNVFDSYDFVQGELVWNFADFQTTEGIMRANGNKKGIFTRQRQPKDAAFHFRARWASLPVDYKGDTAQF